MLYEFIVAVLLSNLVPVIFINSGLFKYNAPPFNPLFFLNKELKT
jgi:hypothetical protein